MFTKTRSSTSKKNRKKLSEPVYVTGVNKGNIVIKAFNIGGDWKIFSEGLEQFLKSNRMGTDRKASILITLTSEESSKTLKNVCYQQKSHKKSYNQLFIILANQCKPTVSLFQKIIQYYSLK